MVWSAFMLIAKKPRSDAKIAPPKPAKKIAIINKSCGELSNAPMPCILLINKMPQNAPITIKPSRAILTVPLFSENIPAKATINSGMTKNNDCEMKYAIRHHSPFVLLSVWQGIS